MREPEYKYGLDEAYRLYLENRGKYERGVDAHEFTHTPLAEKPKRASLWSWSPRLSSSK